MEKDTNGKKKPFKFKSVKKVDKSKSTGSLEEKSINETNNKKKKKSKKGWKIFRICLFIFLALMIICAGIVVGVITGIIDKTESLNVEDIKNQKETTFFYDKDNNEIGSCFDVENRISIEYKDVPKSLVDAIVSIEDERFFKHNGVDIKRTAGAVVEFVFSGGKSSFGGSTITQQLIKNISKDKESSWTRKIREWYRAVSLENKLNKEEILASYVSTIYLGENCYGVEVASQTYFGKSIKEINIAESAVIAAMIQTPEATNPYKSEESKEKLIKRQKLVLNQMLKLEKISQEQYDEACAYKLEFKRSETKPDSNVQSYFVDAVFEQVLQDLMEQKNVSKIVAEKMLFTDGLKIYTTQDKKIQSAIDNAYNNEKIFYTDKAGTYMQSSMVVMDQINGNVLGLIGGAGKKEGARGFNRATQAKRQPGSCMKPLGAYGPAFEAGVLSPGSGLDDVELIQGNFRPGNYYGYFNGYVTAREGLAYSMNIPAVRANQKVDINSAYLFAKNTGLYNLVETDKNSASLALGGVSGVTVLEMANAYSTIANGGLHIEPKLYTKVVDRNGKELLTTKSEAKVVMKDSTAYMLTSCLESVIKPGGTAYGHIKLGKMPITGKTGNTNDDKDQWFCGFTPYYTIACWNGYDDPKSINRQYPYASMRLFNTVMNDISKDLPIKQFNKPASIVNASVCKVSGLVATDACRKDPRGDQTRNDIFATGTIPTKQCTIHKMAQVCKETGKLITEFCPEPIEKSFITRDFVPGIKPNDWKYMMPTEKCDKHTKKIEPEKPPEKPEEIDPYAEKPGEGGGTKPKPKPKPGA